MSVNPFVLDKSEYKRDIRMIEHYLDHSATYLSKMSNRPYEECLDYVKKQIAPGGKFYTEPRRVMFLERNEFGDREKKVDTFENYLYDAIKYQRLTAPNFTIYKSPKEKKSWLTEFVEKNIAKRSAKKKEMLAAENAGDTLKQTIADCGQNTKKISNNSLSGAHVSQSTPFENKTSHSTLTSNCRLTSGYGNANNERLLAGQRHYWHPTIVRNNITSIIRNVDYSIIEEVMIKYNLHYPTVDDVMECILHSSAKYWFGNSELELLKRYVCTLNPLERTAFVYVGDLYHIRKHNDAFVRGFITHLSTHEVNLCTDVEKAIEGADGDTHVLASLICVDEVREYMTKNNLKGASGRDLLKTEHKFIYASVVDNIKKTVENYSDFIRAFFVTNNVTPTIAQLPTSIRSVALISDTDSTIFTTQEWVKWHQGKIGFDSKCYAVTNTMVFLAAKTVVHMLAIMSVNSGIEKDRLHQMAMKTEFTFDILAPTQVAKHYFGGISCREGNIFKDIKSEIKGVHLKSSNVNKQIMRDAKKLMDDTVLAIMRGEQLSALELFKMIADKERMIIESIKKGSPDYFKRGTINPASGYTAKEDSAPYQQYLFWNEVFGPKYGVTVPPPYRVSKVSVDLDTPVKVRAWIESIQDIQFRTRLINWMEKTGKTSLGSVIQVPTQTLTSSGMPEELINVVGMRRIILDTVKVFYIFLETLGIDLLDDNITFLLSDHY